MTNDVIDMDEMLGGRNDLLRSRSFRKKLQKRLGRSRGKLRRSEYSHWLAEGKAERGALKRVAKSAKRTRRLELLLEAQKKRKPLRRKGFSSRIKESSALKRFRAGKIETPELMRALRMKRL